MARFNGFSMVVQRFSRVFELFMATFRGEGDGTARRASDRAAAGASGILGWPLRSFDLVVLSGFKHV